MTMQRIGAAIGALGFLLILATEAHTIRDFGIAIAGVLIGIGAALFITREED